MAVTINGDGVVDVGGNASSAAYVRLYEDSDNGTNYVDLIAPASVASNRTLDLPDASGTIDRLNRAGNVLQVVSANVTTRADIGSTSYTDTGVSASITPTSASSKILVVCSLSVGFFVESNAPRNLYLNLVRSSTQLLEKIISSGGAVNSTGYFEAPLDGSFVYLDSPSTTSATTYKIQAKASSTANSTFIVVNRNTGGTSTSVITLMEIAA